MEILPVRWQLSWPHPSLEGVLHGLPICFDISGLGNVAQVDGGGTDSRRLPSAQLASIF